MTGYEKSPDYGGPEPGRWWFLGPMLILAAILLLWAGCYGG